MQARQTRTKAEGGKPMQAFKWKKSEQGILRAIAGTGKFQPLLALAGVPARSGALAELGPGRLKLKLDAAGWRKVGGNLVLSFPLDKTEKIYGLGLNFETLNQRGTVRELKVDHYGQHDNGHTHAPVPFYVSDRGYGVFVNLAERIKVYVGTTHPVAAPHPPMHDRTTDPNWRDVSPSSRIEILVPGGAAEVFVFAGPAMLDVVKRFNLLCGGGCLPPRWGLGFWHRVPMVFSAKQAEAEVRLFSEHDCPLDVIGLEPGWHTACYPTSCEFSRQRFPDPAGFASRLKRQGIRVNLWENCMIHPASPLGKKIRPYSGNYYAGWGGLIADLASPEACAIVSQQHDRRHLAPGFSGYKLDECDGLDQWLWPDHAEFPSGLSGVQLRQAYGVLFQKLTASLFRKRNLRTYGQVRASNAGGVSFPYVIYNDCYEHRQYITGLANSGFCGVLFTPEARGADSPEEWLRRMQAVCMSPLAQVNAWAIRILPWSFPEVARGVLEIVRLRMRLVPYLYSAFARYQREGLPPFRALALDGVLPGGGEIFVQGKLDDTGNPYSRAVCRDIRDQYMMGDSIMVAPLFAGEQSREVLLPRGRWYDFYSGRFAGGNTLVRVDNSYPGIPMYVRDGGIVPLMAEAFNRTPVAGEIMELEIRHYGEKPGNFMLYDDDGETLDHERGAYRWLALSVTRQRGAGLAGALKQSGGNYASTYRIREWRLMTRAARARRPIPGG